MKKGLGAVAVLALATSSALAGTVSFSGPSSITPGTASVQYQISVDSTSLSGFDTLNMIIGSIDGLGLSFVYDPAFVASETGNDPPAPAEQGIYQVLNPAAHDIGFGGNRFSPLPPWTATPPLLIGTLTVDTGSLAMGQYGLRIDPVFETDLLGSPTSLVALGNAQDALSGGVTLSIVPEPATMLLLGIGGLVALRRRMA